MPKTKTRYRCSNCGHEEAGWFASCRHCGHRGEPEEVIPQAERPGQQARIAGNGATGPGVSFKKLGEIASSTHERFSSGIPELDRVLGGGIVVGSYILVAGEPGAGKTTLTTQMLIELNRVGRKVGLISGEESAEQARMRFSRIAGEGKMPDGLDIGTEVVVERIIESVAGEGFDVLVIDSIQTVYSEDIPGAPGSISQLKGCGALLMQAAKQSGTTIVLIGQVTKSDEVAGPRALEHAVDAFLIFEGDRREQFRILRTMKNRFGSTDEIAAFEMTGRGLAAIDDPSALFCSDDTGGTPGSAVCALIEGTRPLLCQVEALVNPSNQPMPTRSAHGIDQKRMQKLLAVLSRKCNFRLGSCDVFLNVAGGLKADEPAIDLAICLAVASAYSKRPVKEKTCAFGEVSLLGLVRPVAQSERRKAEASRLGYTPYAPEGQLAQIIEKALSSEKVEETVSSDLSDLDD